MVGALQPRPPILLRGTKERKLRGLATTASSDELGLQRRWAAPRRSAGAPEPGPEPDGPPPPAGLLNPPIG
jgi:hypothetical protein